MLNENITKVFLDVSFFSVNPSYCCCFYISCWLSICSQVILYVLSKKLGNAFKRLVPFECVDHWILNFKNLFLRSGKRIITTLQAQQIATSTPNTIKIVNKCLGENNLVHKAQRHLPERKQDFSNEMLPSNASF